MTEETKGILLQGIQAGLTYELACNAAGISYQTFRNWMKAGAAAKTGHFLEFFEEVKKVEGQGAMRLISLIQRAGNEGHWQAAAWILERRYRESYGRGGGSLAAGDGVNVSVNVNNNGLSGTAKEIREIDSHISELDREIAELEAAGLEAQEGGAQSGEG